MDTDQKPVPTTQDEVTRQGGRRKTIWVGLAIFVLALLPRLGVVWETRDVASFTVPIGEGAVYDRAARGLLGDDGATPLLFWRSPTYVAFLAAVQAASGSVVVVRALQALLGALTCWLLFALARRRLGDGLAAMAGLVAAWWGPLIFFDSLLLPVTVAGFLSLLLIALLECAATRERSFWGLAFGGVVGVALLTQITFLPFAILALAWLGWTKGRDRPRMVVSSLVGCGLVLLPAAWVALAATGSVDPLPKSRGFDLFLGNHSQACALLEKPPRQRFEDLDALPARSPNDAGPDFVSKAGEELRREPRRFISGLVSKMGRLTSSRELGDLFDVYAAGSSSKLLRASTFKLGRVGFPWVVLLPFALLGLVLRRVKAPLGLFLLAYSLALVLTRVDGEGRAVLIPALVWTAAWGVGACVEAWRASRTAPRLAAVAVLVLGVLLAILPGPFCEEGLAAAKARDYELGASYDERDDVAAAVTSYQRALEQDVHFAAAHRQLGRLFAAGGEPDGAIAHYRSLLQLSPDAETHTVLAELLQRQGKVEEALIHRQALMELDPENTAARLALGEALVAAGHYDQAKEILEETVRRAPAEARAHFFLGGLYLRLGSVAPAIAELEESLRLEPTAAAHNELGTALIGLQRLDEAGEHFRAAIAEDPSYLDAYSNAGAVSAMQGQLGVAGEYFSQAIQRDPNYVDARYNLAWVLLQQGEAEAAVTQLQEVLRRRPDHQKARQQLQVLLGQGGEGGP